jgi:hypothetical protein
MRSINDSTTEQREELIGLQLQLDKTSLFLERMELEDQIMDLKIKYKLITPTSSSFDELDCIGCGS